MRLYEMRLKDILIMVNANIGTCVCVSGEDYTNLFVCLCVKMCVMEVFLKKPLKRPVIK